MNRKVLINSAAVLMLLVGISTIFVSSAYAHPGEVPDPPPPVWNPPTTPEPPGDGDSGDTGDNKKSVSVITKIFKVMFDTSTMKDAIVNSIDSIFDDAIGTITTSSSPLYKMGSEISEIVFNTEKLEEVRKSSWIQLRKVAFALLPLTAALTIWASMKDGLYSVTGYANTFEAVAEFFVSIAIALASYWLMEQAISLVKILTLAIADTLQVDIEGSVFAGLVIKSISFGATNPIMSMILNILGFALVLTYMGSVVIAFLAREVVILMTVALAPLMIVLGSVRPLAWLRALWGKAFLFFLLLLPINVLTMGLAFKLLVSATDLSTGSLAALLQLAIITGTMSVLIAVNGTLGKLVYGAAIEVAQKVGESVAAVASLAVGAVGGIGALLGSAGAVAGTAPVVAGGGGTGGSMALATTGGGAVTSTSQLTSTIGNVLSSSRNGILRSMGGGLKAGNAIRDHKMSNAPSIPSPKLGVAENGVPGLEAGKADAMSQIDTPEKARAIGSSKEILTERADLGVNTARATLVGAENDDISTTDVLREANYLGPGNWDVKMAGREFVRSEASSFAFHDKGAFRQKEIPTNTPTTKGLHGLDFVAAQRIVQYDQRHTTDSPFHQISPAQIQDVARAVRTQRLSGMNKYPDIIDGANHSASLSGWLRQIQGKT